LVLAAAGIAVSPAFAKKKEEEQAIRIPTEEEAGRILTVARQIKNDKGCADAAPHYRVAAAMGEGFEVAQRELGGCLLEMTGSTDAETALFRKEGMFWLERAAYAGNAAAQKALATELAKSPAASADAFKWALAFEKSGEAKLYGYAPLAPQFTEGLRAALTPQQIADAESFAANFSVVRMAPYAAPPRERSQKDKPPMQPELADPNDRRRPY
jgi:TPR repeat protein